MTQSLLSQLIADPRYHTANTVWYRDHPFRVSIKSHLNRECGDDSSRLRKLNQDIKRCLNKQNIVFRRRIDWTVINFYVKTEEDVNYILNLADSDVIEIHGPVSDAHKNVMVSQINTVVRKDLFYKKYPYKLKFEKRKNELEFFDTLNEFVDENFAPEDYKLNEVLRMANGTLKSQSTYRWINTGIIYLKNYDDVCTLHMIFKEHITKTMKVVLFKDLE